MSSIKTYPQGGTFNGKISLTAATSEPSWPVAKKPPKDSPNILVILLDDVGFAQLGCFGSDISTPNIDLLAKGGLRYRDFHTTAICSPTRACLLTGRNHHSNGVGIIQEMATGYPGYNGMVPKENGFLSEILLDQGYATFAIGKWHLTLAGEYASGASKARWPLSRGFERFYGFLGGKTNQWSPTLVHDSHYIEPPKSYKDGYHLNADLADRAMQYITDLRAVSPDKPFFMYYCLGAGHAPHHVEPEWIEKYKGRFDMGWEKWREKIYQNQLEIGIIPNETQLSERPQWVQAWDDLSGDAKRLYAKQMEVYAAFLEQTDHHLGRLFDDLKRRGEWDNTIIVLASDNGASAEGGEHGSFNECQFPNRIEPTIQENLQHLDEWGSVNSYPNYAWGWAWAGNTPLRRWKRYLHQGGMSDPFIIHWPNKIKSQNQIRGQYAHAVDITPTILEAIGISAPTVLNSIAQTPMQGVSFAHTFSDAEVLTRKKVQYYEMIASRALWADGWKAVVEQPQGEMLTEEMLQNQKWELYHVEKDFSECFNLADVYPEKLQELIDLWWKEAKKYNVLPLDSRMQMRMGERKPSSREPTSRYVYEPDGAAQFEYTAVNVKNKSHTITAKVLIPPGGAQGVLLAHGSWFAGYSLFVKNNKLVYVHNYVGIEEYEISSTNPIPEGEVSLEFEFVRTQEHQGYGMLRINGEEVGRGLLPRMIPAVIETSGEGLCCGYDSGLPVTRQYESPFRFSGLIHEVIVQLHEDAPDNAQDLIQTAFTDH